MTSITHQRYELSQERQESQNHNLGACSKSSPDSLGTLAQRLSLVRREFERSRRLGLPAPTWSELDRLCNLP